MTDTELQLRFLERLVTLADAMVGGFDIVDLADQLVHGCLDISAVAEAGILLDDQRGQLRVLAASSDESRLLELMELQSDQGPCLEAFRTGERVLVHSLNDDPTRWPAFAGTATAQGVTAVYALPMRLRERTIGALNVFCRDGQRLDEHELQLTGVMATMGTVGILSHWTFRRQEILAEQLQTALESRVVIEQAKGVVAEREGIGMGAAFIRLRDAARSTRRPLSELAADVALGRLPSSELDGSPSPKDGPTP